MTAEEILSEESCESMEYINRNCDISADSALRAMYRFAEEYSKQLKPNFTELRKKFISENTHGEPGGLAPATINASQICDWWEKELKH